MHTHTHTHRYYGVFFIYFHLLMILQQQSGSGECLFRFSVLHLSFFQGDILQSLLFCNKHFSPEGMFGTQPQCEIAVADKVYMNQAGSNLLPGLESAVLFTRPSKESCPKSLGLEMSCCFIHSLH